VKRVHRNLSRDEVEALRERLASLVPTSSASVAELLRMMRLIARKSQAEYARMCGVAPRVLANIESGMGSPTVETLGKLLRPFGYRVGVVRSPVESSEAGLDATAPPSGAAQPAGGSALSRALRRGRQPQD
jgi:transcriptional regulator with XRE-family HTH domain